MIHLFTDFGLEGPYLGEMEAVVRRIAPEVPVVRLMNDVPAFSPRPAAYLLAALAERFAPGDVALCVVDPGVGTERRALALECGGRWFVGPDNGLFELVLRRHAAARCWEIVWRPERLSASFHGRDLFAPIAARLARGDGAGLRPCSPMRRTDWPDELQEVIYVDRYGNAWTGMRAESMGDDGVLVAAGRRLGRRTTFGDAAPGEAFWYVNSAGLVEIAVREGSAAARLGLAIGAPVEVVAP